jgi:hypothetical protein
MAIEYADALAWTGDNPRAVEDFLESGPLPLTEGRDFKWASYFLNVDLVIFGTTIEVGRWIVRDVHGYFSTCDYETFTKDYKKAS